ncbi:endonuclease/exonuclease/phosphatase family protein [Flavobacterium frigidarium]|uniref:endonuclease/exonuclease/phosphatase family protein n=1 Tax=Flavobacterium frigidarium TaxID=99286 RepID=UPI00047D089F|nr:endonuclease/exonuclease/phosphatase family protein [Flavobacterium frigidarium]
MRKNFTFLLFIICTTVFSQVKLLSWNIENLGKSKTDAEIAYIAGTIRNFDIVAIQEVVAGYGGAQAVAKLVDALNRKGSQWNYEVSPPTVSSAYKTERYAFLWKPSKVKKIGKSWLEIKFQNQIDREPFFATFSKQGKTFTVVNFHAITKSKQPETEIKYFKFLPQEYPSLNLIFAGDFNCPQSHSVFNPIKKMGYLPSFVNQKTSLKRSCKDGNCLASEFDNIYYLTKKVQKIEAGVLHFYTHFNSLLLARQISDHIPIWLTFELL